MFHFTDKKTKVGAVTLLDEGHESRGAGILSEVPPTPQSESFKHDAILVKIQGEFFFFGGGDLDQRTM